MRKWALTSSFILVGLAAVIFWTVNRPVPAPIENYQEPVYSNTDEKVMVWPVAADDSEPQALEPTPKEPKEHAIKVLPVPFTVQAPFANWDMPYQEACEEAAMIMVVEFLSGQANLRLAPEEANKKILELIQWETDNGYAIDITAAEVVKVLNERFGVRAEVKPYSTEVIKQEINSGHPVILPAVGRLLGNPYFRQPGPLYHMLVVKGFDGEEFITNDPGTRRGENFRYHYSIFDRAVHDWNGGEVESGEQVMIVLFDNG